MQYDESQTTHTVHLVCSHAENSSPDGSTTPISTDGSPVTTPAASPRPNSTDGVRHRQNGSHRRQNSIDTPVTTGAAPLYGGAPHEAFQQFYG